MALSKPLLKVERSKRYVPFYTAKSNVIISVEVRLINRVESSASTSVEAKQRYTSKMLFSIQLYHCLE